MCPCEKIILFLVAKAGEYTPGGFLDALLTNRNSGPTNGVILWQIQCNVIADLAKKGPCVIVGRCADFIGERTETPEQRLKDKDKRRSTYYRFYTGQKWGQVQSYDMTMNSGKLGIEKCAELICTILA